MHEKYKKTSIRELKMLALLEKYGGVGEKSDGKRTNPLNLPAVGRSPFTEGLEGEMFFKTFLWPPCEGRSGGFANKKLNKFSKYIHNLFSLHHHWHKISPKDGNFRRDAIFISSLIMIAIAGVCESD